jgi:hypothetical protein
VTPLGYALLAFIGVALLVDAWYTRKWLRASKAHLEELQAFARRQLDRGPKP